MRHKYYYSVGLNVIKVIASFLYLKVVCACVCVHVCVRVCVVYIYVH